MAAASTQVPVRQPVTCAHPGCPGRFVPKTKDHKYCSATCKNRSHAYRFALNGGR